jgi:hypothetical protein
VRQLP